MNKSLDYQSEKAGLAPGTLVHVGEVHESEVNVTIINYDTSNCKKIISNNIEDITAHKINDTVTWVNIEGLHDVKIIDEICSSFNVHPLVVEDILNTNQRTKIEEFEDHIFIIFNGISVNSIDKEVDLEQIGILILNNYIFTFKEKNDDLFEPLEARIKNNKGLLRKNKADYLAYAILDTIVDQYFLFQDLLDEDIESIEEDLLNNPSQETLIRIQNIKKQILSVRRCISPLRDVLTALYRSDSALIKNTTKIYIRDVHDHALRVIESIDSYREIVSGMLEIYLSTVSNKMNEVMKVLTVFASIFIPLTFIVGIYGMNFEHMPELGWKWAYPTLWIVFIGIPIALLIYFKRKKWL